MKLLPALLLLSAAALLEAGGDALVRKALAEAGALRLAFFAAGAGVLLGYGTVVNLPGWDFGRLLGVYVALFFLMAQLIAYFAFGQRPAPPVLAGGALILAGGCVLTFWRSA